MILNAQLLVFFKIRLYSEIQLMGAVSSAKPTSHVSDRRRRFRALETLSD